MSVENEIQVPSEIKLKNIADVAKKAGISPKVLRKYGEYIAKVPAELLHTTLEKKKNGKLILVTSITPTHLGEGKTVTAIGLGMALNKAGKKAISCIRQAAIGPLFGFKGVGTGGGQSKVMPVEEVNLNLTGDFYAIANAQNLCAAVLDNSFFWTNPLKLDKENITFRRVIDVNDRALRNVTIGGGGKLHGVNRKTGVDTTAAGEVMAILSLAEDLKDLRQRLGKIVVGFTSEGKKITADDLRVAGAMTVLLKEAFNPNLVQTAENTPCFVHTGPYANVSHGSSSVIADKIALKLADYVVTEAGFAVDLGSEKFFDIKCRQANMKPDVVVIVCSVRSLKVHSGDYVIKGTTITEELKREDLSAVDRGCSNLEKQVESLKMFGVPIVVCVNRYESDSKKEVEVVLRRAEALGVQGIAVSEMYKYGSAGGKDLVKAVMEAAKTESKFRFLYPVDMSLKNKIERIAKSMYGASDIKYSEEASSQIERLEKAGLDKLPVCMAKTHLSLSNNPKKKGRPRGFTLTIEAVEPATGAGYIVASCDGVNAMPGLPEKPRIPSIDIDVKTGKTKGLF
jgi:formate--tetrahydrofolate ligase